MRRSMLGSGSLALLLLVLPGTHAGDDDVLFAPTPVSLSGPGGEHAAHGRRLPLLERFQNDPQRDRDAVLIGAAADRLSWAPTDPAWPGDRRGSLTALYDSSLPAGLFGFRLQRTLSERDTFTAAAAFVLDPDDFHADPDGFFEISWGLFNTHATGLDRTGSFTSSADTFDLLEFDYFPNVSPFFGGPFLSPTLFGEDVHVQDAFANAAFTFGLQVPLPLGVPLLAVIEHEPELDVAVVSVHRIVGSRQTVPIPGAVNVIDLSGLASRHYVFDALGLTLWHDGFGGATPALQAKLELHALALYLGVAPGPGQLLEGPPKGW